jgi:hypothetical protein
MITAPPRVLVALAACLCSGLAVAQTFRPVTDSNRPVEAFGFSVLPPAAEEWYFVTDASSETVAFGKKDPEYAKLRGSLLVVAARMRARESAIDTADGLRTEVIAQVKASSARFTLLSLEVEPYRDEEKNTDCVRIKTTSQERSNPNRPGEVLLMTISGKACRLPDSPRHYVQVTISERRPNEVATLLDDTRRAECNRTIHSLQFLPAR